MARMRMSMRKIREVLRLTHELGLSVREVREATGVGKTAVSEYVRRAKVVGLTWPIPPEISDAALERWLFTPAGFHEGSTKPLPDWTKVHEELKRRGVTLMILWEEHRAAYVDGHGYSRFCELYGEWRRRLSPTMRQTHVAGDTRRSDPVGPLGDEGLMDMQILARQDFYAGPTSRPLDRDGDFRRRQRAGEHRQADIVGRADFDAGRHHRH